MKFAIKDLKTNIIGAWCSSFKTANKIRKDLYRIDLRLYGKSNNYAIILDELNIDYREEQ